MTSKEEILSDQEYWNILMYENKLIHVILGTNDPLRTSSFQSQKRFKSFQDSHLFKLSRILKEWSTKQEGNTRED